MNKETPYEVGFGKPPKQTRFKPGQSGNPKGRKPQTLNLKTDLEQELLERIPIREGDRHVKVSKQRALLKAMLAKGLKGDVRAASIVLQLVAKTITPSENDRCSANEVSDEEVAIVESFIERRLAAKNGVKSDE